jgi:hypothetical protein
VSREAARSLLEHWSAQGRKIIHEADTKRILQLVGIEVPERDPGAGRTVVKLASDRFPHKTEHGLVRLGIDAADAGEVGKAMRRKDAAGEVLIERMIEGVVAEWIVGCKHDTTFGPVLLAGPGGTLVEIIDEVEIRLAPASAESAASMLQGRVSNALLDGARGKPPGDRNGLAALSAALSVLFAENADLISEIEVNPAMVLPNGVVAADALLILKGESESKGL